MRTFTIPALLIALTAATGTAAADARCSDVAITVQNSFISPDTRLPVEIKVVDFTYYDAEDQKTRNEVTDNKRINAGSSATWTKGLEYVGGEPGVYITAKYRYATPGGGWSAVRSQRSATFTCVDHMAVTVTVQ